MLFKHSFEHSELGVVEVTGSSDMGITAVNFRVPSFERFSSTDPLLLSVVQQLGCYLSGEIIDFRDIPLSPQGTAFQKAVWDVLRTIPFGETRSYLWVAEQLGYAKASQASRAVGQANGRNPIPILIPCHRVIQHSGGLGGYSGGLAVKQFLLGLEKSPLPLGLNTSPSDFRMSPPAAAMALL